MQQAICNTLQTFGFMVLSTSEHRSSERCPHCTRIFTPSSGRGTTPGVPDLIVTHPQFPRYLFAGLEVKGPRTVVSPAQLHLEQAGRIRVIRSAEEALQAMKEVRQLLQVESTLPHR